MHPRLFLPVEVIVQQSEVVGVVDFGKNCAKLHPSQANDNISLAQHAEIEENPLPSTKTTPGPERKWLTCFQSVPITFIQPALRFEHHWVSEVCGIKTGRQWISGNNGLISSVSNHPLDFHRERHSRQPVESDRSRCRLHAEQLWEAEMVTEGIFAFPQEPLPEGTSEAP